jgi:hypothetical protein
METPTTVHDASRQARCYERAQEIANEMRRGGLYQCFDQHDGTYLVVKQAHTNRTSDNAAYTVYPMAESCTCPDWQTNRDFCKHVLAVDLMLTAIAEEEAIDHMVELDRNAECSTGTDAHCWIDLQFAA